MRTFEFRDDKSAKFWNITFQGKSFTVNYGKIGSTGQTQTKDFPDEAKAKKEHDKLIAEKTGKGYVETTSGGGPAPTPAPAAAAPVAQPSKPAKAPQPVASQPVPAAATGAAPSLRTFTFSDDKAHKFWNIELQGKSFIVTYGRQGGAGQTQTKAFPDEAKAKKEYDKLIAEKTSKGYRETTPSAAPAPTSLLEALEQALVANPEDLASHMAYADYLSEQADPISQARAEFIRTQLALEDTHKPAGERKKLQALEKKLQEKHQADWLGEVAPMLLNPPKDPQYEWRETKVTFSFARGWLDSLEVENYTVAFTRALAQSPATRLLRRLILREPSYEEEGSYEQGDIPEDCDHPQVVPLFRSPYLENVRILQLGEQVSSEEDRDGSFNCHTPGFGVMGLVKMMPKLEELYLLAHHVDGDQLFALKTLHHLRVLQLYHSDSYPLAKLAKNPSLGQLTHLLCHPHAVEDEETAYITLAGIKALVRSEYLPALTHLRLRLSDAGDKGVKEIVDSGILKRLKLLDLRHGCITDKGAQSLAGCPDLKNLELLDLGYNALTKTGSAALRATGVPFHDDNQHKGGDGDQEYLYAGDIE